MITSEPVGLPLGTHMLLWETLQTSCLLKLPWKCHQSWNTAWPFMWQHEWDSLLKTPDSTGSGMQIWLDLLLRTKHIGVPYIALWHHHELEQKHLEMTRVPEWGSNCLHFTRWTFLHNCPPEDLNDDKVRNKFLLSRFLGYWGQQKKASFPNIPVVFLHSISIWKQAWDVQKQIRGLLKQSS